MSNYDSNTEGLKDSRRIPISFIDNAFCKLNLSPEALAVYLNLCYRAGQKNWAYPSYARIGKDCFTQVTRKVQSKQQLKTIPAKSREELARSGIEQLKQLGLIQVKPRFTEAGQTSNLYILNDIESWEHYAQIEQQKANGTYQEPEEVAPPYTGLPPLPHTGPPPSRMRDPNHIQENHIQERKKIPPNKLNKGLSHKLTSPQAETIEGELVEPKSPGEQASSNQSFLVHSSESNQQCSGRETHKTQSETDSFDEWWHSYRQFCVLVQASPGSRGEARQRWSAEATTFESALFLAGDQAYKQQKLAEFKRTGRAIGVSHACRYLVGKAVDYRAGFDPINTEWYMAHEREQIKVQAGFDLSDPNQVRIAAKRSQHDQIHEAAMVALRAKYGQSQ